MFWGPYALCIYGIKDDTALSKPRYLDQNESNSKKRFKYEEHDSIGIPCLKVQGPLTFYWKSRMINSTNSPPKYKYDYMNVEVGYGISKAENYIGSKWMKSKRILANMMLCFLISYVYLFSTFFCRQPVGIAQVCSLQWLAIYASY